MSETAQPINILVIKDDATKIPKTVPDLAAARAYEAAGFQVLLVIGENGATAPLPDEAPAAADAPEGEAPAEA